MKPVSSESEKNEEKNNPANPLATKFPGLAIPNDKPRTFSSDEESEDEKNTKRITSKDIFKDESKTKLSSNNEVDEAMAALEALAPSNSGATYDDKKDVKKRNHSRDRKDTKRSTSRERKHRSRSRERRSRSRDLKSNRDRRSHSRGRDRHRRSRERDRRSRSRDRRSRDRDRRRRSRSQQRHRSRSRDKYRRSRSRNRKSRSRSHNREERSKYRDNNYDRKPRKKSPDVEMSDDPEPGKVSKLIILLNLVYFTVSNFN